MIFNYPIMMSLWFSLQVVTVILHTCGKLLFVRYAKSYPFQQCPTCGPVEGFVWHNIDFCWSTVISQLSSQLESELFVRTYVVDANLTVVLLIALANRC